MNTKIDFLNNMKLNDEKIDLDGNISLPSKTVSSAIDYDNNTFYYEKY